MEFVAHFAQHGREVDAERVADGREQLGRRFLLTTLNLGQVTEGNACVSGHVTQRAFLGKALLAQRIAEQSAQQNHRALLAFRPVQETVRVTVPRVIGMPDAQLD